MILRNTFCLTLAMVVCPSMLSGADSGADLSAFRWKHRLLVIFAVAETDGAYIKLNKRLDRSARGVEDRDLIVFRIFEKSPSRIENGALSHRDAQLLRQRFKVPPGQFSVVLVGKDGGVKMTARQSVDLQSVFDLIDRMPMRQQEMRDRSSSP